MAGGAGINIPGFCGVGWHPCHVKNVRTHVKLPKPRSQSSFARAVVWWCRVCVCAASKALPLGRGGGGSQDVGVGAGARHTRPGVGVRVSIP